MPYTILLLDECCEQLRAHPQGLRKEVGEFNTLAEQPWPHGIEKLQAGKGYRKRFGDYRLIFKIDGDKLTILKFTNRKDVYRKR
jgi:mRNA-degrading endonuclease RelE of RelBE toxin-antitoxin system